MDADPGDWIEISESTCLPEKPVVSVLMATYNHGPYLAEAIEGVLMQQTDFPIELLIGEDCSTDDTAQVALAYQRAHPNLIRVITAERNVGCADNIVRMFKAAHGEFIALCEGDDYWIEAKKLQKQVDLLRARPDVTAVFTDSVIAEFRIDRWVVDAALRAFAGLKTEDHRGDLRDIPYYWAPLRTVAAVYRADSMARLFEKRLPLKSFPAGDQFFLAQAIACGNVERLDNVAAVYRRTPGSATRSGPKGHLLMLQANRRFHEQFHVFFPEIGPSRVNWAELDVAICRAAYMAGDSVAYEEAYCHLQAAGHAIPFYLVLLRPLMTCELARRLTVGIRTSVRSALRNISWRLSRSN